MNRCVLALASLFILPAGCGEGTKDFHVSGLITFQGKPIPKGQIFFDPDLAKKNDGPQGYALIVDGKYDTRSTKRGTVGGAYVIRIAGFDGKPGAELPMGSPLFTEYRVERDLPKGDSVQDIDVPAKR
jgi:hypothetical protein